jgi:UDP-N-acetylglucosamine:LPS N-acetylglucosamine transferase
MSGSIGGRFLLKATKALCHQPEPGLNLAVICGNDTETLGKLRHLREGNHPHEILPFGYVDNCDEILAVSSCAVIRPSAGTFNECMISRTPVICRAHTASNDQGAVELIKRHGLGETYQDEGEIPALVRRILEHKSEYIGHINAFLSHYPADYEAIADRLVAEFERAAESGRARNRQRLAV